MKRLVCIQWASLALLTACQATGPGDFGLSSAAPIVGNGNQIPLQIADGGITNALLSNSSLTIAASAPLMVGNGGLLSLGGTISLSCPTCLTGMGATGTLPLFTGSSVLGSSAIFQDADGNLGLDTTAPAMRLQFGDFAGIVSRPGEAFIGLSKNYYNDGSWKYLSDGTAALLALEQSGGIGFYTSPAGKADAVVDPNPPKMFLTNTGSVGIGTASPLHTLDVRGDIMATQGMCCGSSRLLKRDIRDVTTDEAVQALEKLRPSHFAYHANPGEPKLGFIAEDVPDLVAMNDRKSLDPMEFAALLTKVVQAQQKEIKALRERMEAQDRRILFLGAGGRGRGASLP